MKPLQAMEEWIRDKGGMPHFVEVADKALDAVYHYGLAQPGSFGEAANEGSASACLSGIFFGVNDIETLAMMIHGGWSFVANVFDDPIYAIKPQKKEARMALVVKNYYELPEDEKEKDRVIARAIKEDVFSK